MEYLTIDNIRWGLVIGTLIVIAFRLSDISTTLRTIRRLLTITMVHLSHPEIFETVDVEKVYKEVMDDDTRKGR